MDKRLLTCAQLCTGGCIADIGTDHGYLPCYMIKEGLCRKAYACDVAPKPLESARRHIEQQGYEDKITPILSDGLDNVPEKLVTDIVMAGMGGELIARLIEKCSWAKNPKLNFVLQPMTKWDFLRKWLYDNDFEITRELACHEGKFVYSVMQARFIGNTPCYKCDLKYLYCGLVSGETDEGKEYLTRQAHRLEAIGKGLSGNSCKKELSDKMIRLAKEIQNDVR